eukprot:TRINITY_DN16340_c0_g1_i1.p1 TRINITY_DN16340_c0_g1~~TRINITY_DN16340_c0_g1_i1.p1  ORF type:complete len:170 (-),score=37.13 TRINITY_DN16340_c0_g1_i1:105-614(-)
MDAIKSTESERLARRINSLLHTQAPDHKKSGWFDSFGIFFKSGIKHVMPVTERPPFPVLMDKIKIKDIFAYIEKGDVVLLGTCYVLGIVFGYIGSRKINSQHARLLTYHGIAHTFNVFGLGLMVFMPLYRIRGLWDNGLRWKRPAPMKKYNFTSELDKHEVYKHFRVKV